MPPQARTKERFASVRLFRAVALSIARKLGAGHREAVYQRAFVADLAIRGIPSQTEVPVPFFVRGICVGHGRADVVTRSHVIELKSRKATPSLMRATRQQLRRYIMAIHKAGGTRRKGVIVMFDPDTSTPIVEPL